MKIPKIPKISCHKGLCSAIVLKKKNVSSKISSPNCAVYILLSILQVDRAENQTGSICSEKITAFQLKVS